MCKNKLSSKKANLERVLGSAAKSRREIQAYKRELTEAQLIEDKAGRESKSVKVEEHKLTEKYHKETVGVAKRRFKAAHIIYRDDWKQTLKKWKRRLEIAHQKNDMAQKLLTSFGIEPIIDENGTVTLSGVVLTNVNSKHPEYECVIDMDELDWSNWTYKEVKRVTPAFTDSKKFIQEANTRKDAIYTIFLARRNWIDYFEKRNQPVVPITSTRVDVSLFEQSMIISEDESDSQHNASSLLFESDV